MKEKGAGYLPELEEYLDRLEAELAGLPPAERREILLETRSHVLDRAARTGAEGERAARTGAEGERAARTGAEGERAAPTGAEGVRAARTGRKGVSAALAELGEPEEYARRFMPVEAEVGGGAGAITGFACLATGRWTSLIALLFVVLAYTVAILALVAAGLKLAYPDRMGVWVLIGEESKHLTFGLTSETPAGEEVIGYWLVVIGVLIALAIHLSVSAILRRVARSAERGKGTASGTEGADHG